MELEKFEKAKEISEELDDLKRSYNFILGDFNESMNDIVLYDGFDYDGNHGFIIIRHPLTIQLKKLIKELFAKRIEFLEQQFKEL